MGERRLMNVVCIGYGVDILKVHYMPACKGSYVGPVQQNKAENKF